MRHDLLPRFLDSCWGPSYNLNVNGYPWDVGTKLANQIKAKDLSGAEESAAYLIKYIYTDSQTRGLAEIKLRVAQVLTIAGRAVYDAGGNPDELFNVNQNLIHKLAEADNEAEILRLARCVLQELVDTMSMDDAAGRKRVDKALEYIRTHCADEISREAVSDAVACSPSYLSRLFSQFTGHTFKEIVLTHRMRKAQALLSKTELNVTEIAFKLGYKDPNYFSYIFKRYVGIAPSAFRKGTSAAEARHEPVHL